MTQQGDKVTFRISSAAAPYVGADKPREERLKAAAGHVALAPGDFVLLVYYLCHDPDPEVKRTALDTLRGLDAAFLSQLLSDPQLHPRILDVLAKLHFEKTELAELFAAHPMLMGRRRQSRSSLRSPQRVRTRSGVPLQEKLRRATRRPRSRLTRRMRSSSPSSSRRRRWASPTRSRLP